ncbi:CHAD domain-containing protein [Puteibacter caeruleilacunae]|nr:CHAD domain-containing protein [Puteibacter caeruleilacunae]
MKSAELSTYVYELQKDQIRYLELYQKDGVAEDLHQFRLCCKKLSALNRFLEFALNQKQKLNSLHIKQIFKSSGALRDLHIKQNLWETVKNKPKKFSSLFLEELNTCSVAQNIIFTNIIKTSTLLAPKLQEYKLKKLNKTITSYILKLSEDIKSQFNDITCYDDFHQLRRDIKQLFYILRIFNLKTEDISSVKSPKTLKNIETLLGNWHDWIVLDERISTFYFLNKHKKLISSQQFREVKHKLLTKQKQTLNNAIRIIQTD